MNYISAIIVVKDNPPHILKTISSIEDFVNEIIIADIGINNSLIPKFQKNKKIKIIKINKDIPYVEVIREDLKKYSSCSHILFLDPDEIISEALKNKLKSLYQKYSYLQIPRKNLIFGKYIRHSRWWPDYQVRLFKRDSVVWPTEIHKQPIVKGDGYMIEPEEQYAIIHHNYESIDQYLEKAISYAKSEALSLPSFSLGEALKKALSEFVSRYFADEGYKDGMHGFVLAFLQMFYYILVYIYYLEKKKYQDEDQKNLQNIIQQFFREALFSVNHWQNKMNLHSYGEKLKRKFINKLLK